MTTVARLLQMVVDKQSLLCNAASGYVAAVSCLFLTVPEAAQKLQIAPCRLSLTAQQAVLTVTPSPLSALASPQKTPSTIFPRTFVQQHKLPLLRP